MFLINQKQGCVSFQVSDNCLRSQLFLNFDFVITLKKIFSILLLCCLLLNVLGYHIIFYIRQTEVKAEMKRSLLFHSSKEEDLFIISLNDKKELDKLEWEGDDEFELNGEMYDVIEKKNKDGKLIIRCISDKKETALIQQYEKLNKETNSKNRSALLLKIVGHAYISPAITSISTDTKPMTAKFLFNTEIISSYCHDVLTPPPQVC